MQSLLNEKRESPTSYANRVDAAGEHLANATGESHSDHLCSIMQET